MRRWMVLLVLLSLFVSPFPAAASRIAVYFDEAGTVERLQVDAGRPFKFFIAVSGVANGLRGWECLVEVDPRITVTGRTLRGPGPIRVGEGEDNFIVGLSQVVSASSVFPVVEYGAVLLAAEEGLWIGIGPAIQAETQRAPRYLTPEGEIVEFDEATGAVINTEVGSWGDLKEHYQNQ